MLHANNRAAVLAATAVVVIVALSGCSPQPQPEAIVTPSAVAIPEETTAPVKTLEPVVEAVGTRGSPVPAGQVLAFSADSAFQIGASGPTQVTPGYSVMPLVIQIDWANFNAQATAQGQPTGGPFTPMATMRVSFVTAAGKSYDTMDEYMAEIPNQLWEIGDVYEGTDTVNANVPISVPEAELAGGAWVVENFGSGARVFVATQ